MLSRRVDHFIESVIRDMTRLSIKHDAINLAQGFPDFPAPEELKRAAADAIMGDYNQYSESYGRLVKNQSVYRISNFKFINTE